MQTARKTGWEVIFRATPGGKSAIYEAFVTKGGLNENNASMQSVTSSPDGIFRSPRIDTWEKERVLRVNIWMSL